MKALQDFFKLLDDSTSSIADEANASVPFGSGESLCFGILISLFHMSRNEIYSEIPTSTDHEKVSDFIQLFFAPMHQISRLTGSKQHLSNHTKI